MIGVWSVALMECGLVPQKNVNVGCLRVESSR